MTTKVDVIPLWTLSLPELLQQLHTTSDGLTSQEAHQRLIRFGANHFRRKGRLREAVHLLSQFKSPIVLILLSAVGLSFFLGNPIAIVALYMMSAEAAKKLFYARLSSAGM